ncbi:hypothetical protein LWF01_03035 [Saxibacter everestensis]|uniref:DUF2746 domain-containing protein n=1 Tax=Saxibacter everestensis TaxID=2909229 RepID=A0ABY8QWK7_9MICO|nr:hypothetical protein LWF01_03035 [Brevibacteriaceae bacterium ZFBP1038]
MGLQGWVTLASLIIIPFLSYAAARFAGKSTVRAAQISADEGAYTRAQDITDGLIDNLRTELDRAKHDIEEFKATLKVERAESTRLRRHITELESTMARMESQISALSRDNHS